MKPPVSGCRLLLVLICFAGSGAYSQELVLEGDFDQGVAGWATVQGGTLAWDPVRGSPGPGSLRLEGPTPIGGQSFNVVAAGPCLEVGDGERWTIEARVSLSGPLGGCGVTFRGHDNASCSGPNSLNFTGDAVTTVSLGDWDYQSLALDPELYNNPQGPRPFQFIRPGLYAFSLGPPPSYSCWFDSVRVTRRGACGDSESDQHLCLSDRFRVEATFRTENDAAPRIATPRFLTSDTGAFWFFRDGNIELLIKVLDGCPVNGRRWVFAAGLTDVEVEIVATDSETNERFVITNPLGQPFQPVLNSDALGGCP